MKAKNWAGQKYGRLTFIKATDKRRYSAIIWEALCDCGTTIHVVPKDGTSCGCYKKEICKRTGINSKNFGKILYSSSEACARDVWGGRYKDINFEEFYSMSQLPCHYCGRLPHRTRKLRKGQKGSFTYNGLDRIDSSKGHTSDNIVPCCKDCNKAKCDMTYDEFLIHIKRMYITTEHYTLSRSGSVDTL